MIDVLLIAGPTAGGKSALALRVAETVGGEIINADAMQVYAPLRILTARPDAGACAAIPHHLDGVAPGNVGWSAGTFARAAAPIVEGIAARGLLPVIVGGTGLWLRALIDGLSPVPAVPAEAVAAAEARLTDIGLPAFRAEVLAHDPAMARLAATDPQRHVRAAAVRAATGRPLSHWQGLPPQPLLPLRARAVVLRPPRALNHQWAEERLAQMMNAGALAEVMALQRSGLPPSAPVWKALGARPLAQFLEGSISRAAAEAETLAATRQLIKRQCTWFSNQCPGWPQVETAAAALDILRP